MSLHALALWCLQNLIPLGFVLQVAHVLVLGLSIGQPVVSFLGRGEPRRRHVRHADRRLEALDFLTADQRRDVKELLARYELHRRKLERLLRPARAASTVGGMCMVLGGGAAVELAILEADSRSALLFGFYVIGLGVLVYTLVFQLFVLRVDRWATGQQREGLGDLYLVHSCVQLLETLRELEVSTSSRSSVLLRRRVSELVQATAMDLQFFVAEFLGQSAAPEMRRVLKAGGRVLRVRLLELQPSVLLGEPTGLLAVKGLAERHLCAVIAGHLDLPEALEEAADRGTGATNFGRKRWLGSAAVFCVFTAAVIGVRLLLGESSTVLAAAGTASGLATFFSLANALLGSEHGAAVTDYSQGAG